jgi:hypothetical protein
MIDYTNFDRVFGAPTPFPYNRSFIQEADVYRRDFEGALFIDRVLAALGHSKGMSTWRRRGHFSLTPV